MSDHIPTELMLNIFERLPPDCLIPCRIVCKSWNLIVSDPDFIRRYSIHRRTPDMLFVRKYAIRTGETKYTKHSIDRLPFPIPQPSSAAAAGDSSIDNDGIRIPSPYYTTIRRGRVNVDSKTNLNVVGMCNGVVCLSDPRKKRFILWNPSIGCTLSLPPLPVTWKSTEASFAQGFGFDAVNEDYKLVTMLYLNTMLNIEARAPYKVYIYTIKNGTWRSLPCPSPPPVELPIQVIDSPAALVNGVLHWTVSNIGYFHVMSFHLTTEVFGTVALPECFSIPHYVGYFAYIGVTTIGESFAVIYNLKHVSQVWVMQAYGDVASWKLVYDLGDLFHFGFVVRALKLRTTNHGDLVLLTNGNGRTLVYDPLTRSKWEDKRFDISVYLGFYKESLALSNEGRRLGGTRLGSICQQKRKRSCPLKGSSDKMT